MNIRENITSFEAKRAANIARMDEIMAKAAEEGRTLEDAETQEYDGLESEVKTVDAHLARLKKHEASIVANATPVTRAVGGDPAAAAASRAGDLGSGSIIQMKSNAPKGLAFTRYVKALAITKGNLTGALAYAEHQAHWQSNTPEVVAMLKTAVAAGDTTTSGWASELVYPQNLINEFIDVLRPQTILGKLSGKLTNVPFNVRMAGQDQTSSANWVGAGKPTPVSALDTLAVNLGIAKALGLIVLTDELIRSSAPSAEMIVQNDLVKTMATFLDVQFIAPDYAAVAGVNPASVTNGVTPTAATGTTSAYLRVDLETLIGLFVSYNYDPSGLVIVTSTTQALAWSLMLNALGQPLFPNITMNGGSIIGIPVICSQSAKQVGSPVAGEGNLIVLLSAPDILLADDGQVEIDASKEASLEMLTNPTNSDAAGGITATSMVSMFQTNSVAVKSTRYINWGKRRTTAVQYIKDAQYVATAP